MASEQTAWGIDIGECALRALKLTRIGQDVRLEAFDVIEHSKILTQPDADKASLARSALEQFLARNDLGESVVAVSMPGQGGFTRFVKLPPVEQKQVPEIVRFEAEQQIPFPIDEVIWRWQAFTTPDSPDIEVGIFAVRRTDVTGVLDQFRQFGVDVSVVQMAPLALYNFMEFDGQLAKEGATLLIDIGAAKTDLVISEGSRIWTRTLQLGGNNFTQVLMKVFKLSFSKAERLKRTAATSKYARQIFQAMRPVFAELAQEIQRSIGYYTSLHRESRLRKVIGLGNGFRLPGLQKYLEQSLGISVVWMDAYNKLSPAGVSKAPVFTDNVLSFGVSYGLAVQGLGLSKIRTNLLPSESARRRRWAKKRPWFAAAAAMLIVAAIIGYVRSSIDARKLDANRLPPASKAGLKQAEEILSYYQQLSQQYAKVKGQDKAEEKKILRYEKILGYRYFWPTLHYILCESIKDVAKDQGKLTNIDELLKIPRSKRRVIMVSSLYAEYHADVLSALKAGVGTGKVGGRGSLGPRSVGPRVGSPMIERGAMEIGRERPSRHKFTRGPSKKPAAPEKATRPGFVVYLKGSTPLQGQDAVRFISTGLRQAFFQQAARCPSIEVLDSELSIIPGKPVGAALSGGKTLNIPSGAGLERAEVHSRAGVGGKSSTSGVIPGVIDPITNEDASGDSTFVLRWAIVVKDDGLPSSQKKKSAPVFGGVR